MTLWHLVLVAVTEMINHYYYNHNTITLWRFNTANNKTQICTQWIRPVQPKPYSHINYLKTYFHPILTINSLSFIWLLSHAISMQKQHSHFLFPYPYPTVTSTIWFFKLHHVSQRYLLYHTLHFSLFLQACFWHSQLMSFLNYNRHLTNTTKCDFFLFLQWGKNAGF
jgi:hypothetical protein